MRETSGLMNIGPEAFEELVTKIQAVLGERPYSNYTACAALLSLVQRILTHEDADPAVKRVVISKFLHALGYTE